MAYITSEEVMNKMSITSETLGITKNQFNILNAVNYHGRDAFVEERADAMEGVVASVIGPNKKIMDTDYFPMNEFIGQHRSIIKFFTNINDGDKAVTLEYYYKDSEGVEGVVSQDGEYNEYFSNKAGSPMLNCQFFENYQYRIVVKSHPTLAEDEWVALDFIKLEITNPASVKSEFETYNLTSESLGVLLTWPYMVEVTGNGSSDSYSTVQNFGGVMSDFSVACTVEATSTGLGATITNRTSSSFTVTVSTYNGSNWSGSVYVNCVPMMIITSLPIK